MKTNSFSSLLVITASILSCGNAAALSAAEATPDLAWSQPASLPDTLLRSTEGARFVLGDFRGEKATIVVFINIECPISNGYVPTLNRLAKRFQDQGVRIVGLNSNAGQSLLELANHCDEYSVVFSCLQDPHGNTAKELAVQTSPEALLFDEVGTLRYRGRIDDRYVRRGGGATSVHEADLELALMQVLAGEKVTTPRTTTLGCPINFPPEPSRKANRKSELTYTRDIAPILYQRCVECHRNGGIGPFSLASYDDAVRWSDDIEHFTRERIMPPWKPKAGVNDFTNDRSMTAREIELIADWVAADCPEGELSDLPKLPEFHDDWHLGPPDLVLEMAQEFEVSAEGEDDYQCFVLPTGLTERRFVRAIDVQPGNKRTVHHVIVVGDTSGRARQLDQRDPAPGYATAGGYPGFIPSSFLGGWAPGGWSGELPAGVAKILPAESDLVIQVHYFKTGKPERDRTKVGIYFSQTPPKRIVQSLPLAPLPFDAQMRIPPGAQNHEVRTAVVLPTDMSAVSITPHMHLLGKDMKVTATLPDGNIQPLLELVNWDFNWQERYTYREPIALPQGTRIDLIAHYDNSLQNPYNPHRPPQLVTWGENTADEMCIAFLELIPPTEVNSSEELRPLTPREQFQFRTQARQLAGEQTLPPVLAELVFRRMLAADPSEFDPAELLQSPAFRAVQAPRD